MDTSTAAAVDDTKQIKDLMDSNFLPDLKKRVCQMKEEISKKESNVTTTPATANGQGEGGSVGDGDGANKEGVEDQTKSLSDLKKEFYEYLFENREQVLIQFEDLFEDISKNDMLFLYKYALMEMGISGRHVTKILLKFIVMSMEKNKE